MPRLAAIVLAAGGSSRMGRPKQLLSIDGRPLLVRTVATALAAGCRPVVVVLGRDALACSAALVQRFARRGTVASNDRRAEDGRPAPYRPQRHGRDGRLLIVQNPAWETGMGVSLRAGARSLGPVAAAYVLLCDQPGVTAGTLRRLRAAMTRSGRRVCVAAYADTVGPPLLVGGGYLRRLRDWPEAGGAKALWTANPDDVARVACPEAAEDLDTPEAYDDWLARKTASLNVNRVTSHGRDGRSA